MVRDLTTVDEVIDALGGTKAVAELTGRRKLQAVSNWRRPGRRIPPAHYAVMSEALEKLGLRAPRELFGQTTPTILAISSQEPASP